MLRKVSSCFRTEKIFRFVSTIVINIALEFLAEVFQEK